MVLEVSGGFLGAGRSNAPGLPGLIRQPPPSWLAA